MGITHEVSGEAAIAGKKCGPEMVAHWIDSLGEGAPAELLRRTMAARRAGDLMEAENLYQLAVIVHAELITRRASEIKWREQAADLFCAPALVESADQGQRRIRLAIMDGD